MEQFANFKRNGLVINFEPAIPLIVLFRSMPGSVSWSTKVGMPMYEIVKQHAVIDWSS